MYNLLLVDDEPRQVKAMCSIIRQLKPSYEVFQAHEGESALKIIMNQHVDIVISDIRMPGMDGLELMQQVTKLKYPPKLIMLTGFDDFQYAVQAIRNRAYDYLLKPIGKPELIELLDRVEATLHEERAKEEKLSEIENKLSHMLPVFETHLFTRWLDGHLNKEELQQLQTTFLSGAHSGYLIVTEPGRNVVDKEGTTRNLTSSMTLLQDKIQEHLNQLGKPLTIQVGPDRFITVMPLFPDSNGMGQQVVSQLEHLTTDFHMESGLGITIGISSPMDHLLDQVPASYSQVVTAMKYKFYMGMCCLIQAGKVQPLHIQYSFQDDFTHIEQNMRKQNSFQLSRVIQDHLDKLKLHRCDPDVIRTEWTLFMTRLFQSTIHTHNQAEQLAWLAECKNMLAQVQDSYEFKKLVISFSLRLMELEEQQSKNQHRVVIDQCIHYLKAHYQKDLSLEDMAQRFHFHPSYFSTLFKHVTGIGFSEYIQKIRIGMAKELILHTDEKMSDIALQVGFKDAAYFTKIFKKETGISPNKYKRLHTIDLDY